MVGIKMVEAVVKKGIGDMNFCKGGGTVNWFPGHMASATRAIRSRLKLADLVIEVRDSRIPLSSRNDDLQPMIAGKRRIIALNKKDLANPNILPKWLDYFDSTNQDCLPVNAHSKTSVKKLLDLVEIKLKEVISREPTLHVMVVGVPNVGKSALINSIHQISAVRFPGEDTSKRATVGPLPGVTRDIAGFKIAHRPSIYVLDTPGVLVPSISDVETGLKLAAAGSVKDSVVGEERIAQYLLAILNSRKTPVHWSRLRRTGELKKGSGISRNYNIKDLLPNRSSTLDDSAVYYIQDIAMNVQQALSASFSSFDGNLEDGDDMETLIEEQFEALQKALKIAHTAQEGRMMVAKRFLTLFRAGKLGSFILDDVPKISKPVS